MNKSNDESKEPSRRHRLLEFAETGQLRNILESKNGSPDSDVIDLIIDCCIRYCEPRKLRPL